RRMNSSLRASMASANLTSRAPRSRSGFFDQAGKAALAAATALSSCARSARGAMASTSSVAGLITGSVHAPGTSLPSMSNLYSLIRYLQLGVVCQKSRNVELYFNVRLGLTVGTDRQCALPLSAQSGTIVLLNSA